MKLKGNEKTRPNTLAWVPEWCMYGNYRCFWMPKWHMCGNYMCFQGCAHSQTTIKQNRTEKTREDTNKAENTLYVWGPTCRLWGNYHCFRMPKWHLCRSYPCFRGRLHWEMPRKLDKTKKTQYNLENLRKTKEDWENTKQHKNMCVWLQNGHLCSDYWCFWEQQWHLCCEYRCFRRCLHALAFEVQGKLNKTRETKANSRFEYQSGAFAAIASVFLVVSAKVAYVR